MFGLVRKSLLCLTLLGVFLSVGRAQPAFKVIPLGVGGGNDESNLSAYALAVSGTDAYVCLDAGTLYYGIERAVAAQVLSGTVFEVLRDKIKGYLISHPHLDHIAGLILNSPDDSPKPIYGLPFCLQAIQETYFNWKSWPNFGDQGTKPLLNKYRYATVSMQDETPLEGTSMFVRAFPLSHAKPGQSTAFLIRHEENYILYLGDTGADTIEGSDSLERLWHAIGPLVAAGKVKAILVEVSFANARPNQLLFGHLTPRLLMDEMEKLYQLSGDSLKQCPLVITHVKPDSPHNEIKKELDQVNELGLKLVFAEQAKLLEF
jgi:cAMP phosphodiesterase